MEQTSPVKPPESGVIRTADGTAILRYGPMEHGRVLHVEWLLSVPIEAVKHGFVEVLRLLGEHHYPVILSDSDHFEGDWTELIPWVRYEFLPQALEYGLRYLADVLPVTPANSFSVYRWREETRGLVKHGVFSNRANALEWATQMLAREAEAQS